MTEAIKPKFGDRVITYDYIKKRHNEKPYEQVATYCNRGLRGDIVCLTTGAMVEVALEPSAQLDLDPATAINTWREIKPSNGKNH